MNKALEAFERINDFANKYWIGRDGSDQQIEQYAEDEKIIRDELEVNPINTDALNIFNNGDTGCFQGTNGCETHYNYRFTKSQIEEIKKAITAQENSVDVDAARWRALLSSGRIRPLGWAGLNENCEVKDNSDPYLHFGMEVWTTYFDEVIDNSTGLKLLTNYADHIIENIEKG